ncbi:Disintegrin [Ancylostoma ceylanicum]|uniref:Disintegrin n=1 Tax=Ancylostoma ceylanicum TaxID=53326 RepID=A0A0D6M0J8_9BILA|nr:Disintegrin [Ancylostoma ceylanicum]
MASLHSGPARWLLNRWGISLPSQLRECGNGVVDGSEECDCGTRETCTDPCCDPLTCTLRAHAQCAAHHQCCHRCELRKAGEVCRSARSPCDVPETCDGKSGDCPPDGHLVDGTACGRDGQCWRGNCSDPHNQCQAIWGDGARVAEEECFKQNTRGHEYANCGSSDSTGVYRPCQAEHIRCGTLHCQDGATTPMQTALRAFTFQFQQEEKQCKSITDTSVGLVQDGSTCGSGRVCVAGSCVEMSSVSTPVTCPSNNHALQCSGHGDCTTTSLCVCFAGWAGVACDTRTNSTLSKNRGSSRTIVVVPSIAEGKTLDTATLLGILLLVGVVLLLLLVCLLFCYRRRSVVEIPTPSDEKLDESLPDQTQRSIKFGSMPSWRDEKRRRKSNKHVYGALNRITEADERDSASLRSRESGSQNAGSQLLFDPNHQMIPYGRPDMVLPDRIHEHIYAESAIIMSNSSPIHLDHPMRSLNSWSKSPSTSAEHIAPTPLRLNNIKQLLRNLQNDDDMVDELREDNMELLDTRYPLEAYGSTYKPLGEIIGEEELSGVEADHDLGSNTESSRGYELDQRGGDARLDTGEARSSPVGRTACDFRQSPSLFNDSFKLEMSSSIHT